MKKALTTLAAAAAIAVLAVTGSIVGDSHPAHAAVTAPHGHAYGYWRHHKCTHRHPCVNPGGPNIPASIVGDAVPHSIVGD